MRSSGPGTGALASADPDAEVARSIVTAAEDARRRGARALAAELYLLAADRTPPELAAERLDSAGRGGRGGRGGDPPGNRGPGGRGGYRG